MKIETLEILPKTWKKKLNVLRRENVEGLLIDLRNNGGGSLDTAIKIAGLFVDKGPVCSSKNIEMKLLLLNKMLILGFSGQGH